MWRKSGKASTIELTPSIYSRTSETNRVPSYDTHQKGRASSTALSGPMIDKFAILPNLSCLFRVNNASNIDLFFTYADIQFAPDGRPEGQDFLASHGCYFECIDRAKPPYFSSSHHLFFVYLAFSVASVRLAFR